MHAHGGDRGIAAAGDFEIAEAGDGDAFWHKPAAALTLHHRAKRRKVGHADRRLDLGPLLDEPRHRLAALFHRNGGRAEGNHPAVGQAQFSHRGFVSRPPVGTAGIAAGGAADEGDLAIALGVQIFHQCRRGFGIGKTHHMPHWRFRQVPGFDHRDGGLFEQTPRPGRVAATSDDDALGAPPQHGLDELFLFPDGVIGIAEKEL